MRSRAPNTFHDRFLHEFFRNARLREKHVLKDGAASWSDHAAAVLHAVQSDFGLYCACNRRRDVRHFGERREWLWDFSWYESDSPEHYAPPRVVIEHENSHDDTYFMDDFWKVLAAYAPLRVMIGYTGQGSSLMDRRIKLIHQTTAAWEFPPTSVDIVILRRYGHSQWEVLLREIGQRAFTHCTDAIWAR